jgi:hypothetical protein
MLKSTAVHTREVDIYHKLRNSHERSDDQQVIDFEGWLYAQS